MTPNDSEPRPGKTWGRGRVVVAGLMALAVAATATTAVYQQRARARFAAMIEEGSAGRIQAFTRLLQIHRLRALSRRYGYLPATAPERACGVPYLRLTAADGSVLHVLRGADMGQAPDVPAASQGLVIVVSSAGRILYTVENACVLSLPASAGEGDAVIYGLAPGHRVQLSLVGNELEPALRLRGPLRLETAEGTRVLGGGDEAAAPLFSFDAEARCFRGPAGGPGKAWEVDLTDSPRYCRQ